VRNGSIQPRPQGQGTRGSSAAESEGKSSCRRHRTTPQNQRTDTREKSATVVRLHILVISFQFFGKDDMMPFLLRSPKCFLGSVIVNP
jgi:hypothetical protein